MKMFIIDDRPLTYASSMYIEEVINAPKLLVILSTALLTIHEGSSKCRLLLFFSVELITSKYVYKV
jgi:hypothetical protein